MAIISRTNSILLIATIAVFVASTSTTFFTTTVVEARLQGGHNNQGKNKIKNKNKQQRERERKLTEKEEDDILATIDNEYRTNEALKQKEHEKAMAMASSSHHNKVVPTHVLLQEVQALDKESALEEANHQAQAKKEEEEEQQQQAKTTATATVDDGSLESILTMKKEYKKYKSVEKKKKDTAASDKKVFQQWKKATLAHEKEQKEMVAQAHLHMHGNDKMALVEHEASMSELQMNEQKAQEEAMEEQMVREKILHEEYEKQMNLEIRMMELLGSD